MRIWRSPFGLSLLALLILLVALAAFHFMEALGAKAAAPTKTDAASFPEDSAAPTASFVAPSSAGSGVVNASLPTSPSTAGAAQAAGKSQAMPASRGVAASNAVPPKMDLSRRATAPGAKGPKHPTLKLPNALDLEAVFNPAVGEPVKFSLAPDFAFEGTVTVRSPQLDGSDLAVGASDGVSLLSLVRERLGRYGGTIYHKGSSLAHRITTADDGALLVEQVPLSEIICAPAGAVFGEAVGLMNNAASAPVAPAAAQVAAATTIPALDSLPSAEAVIYLDFDGETVSGTQWNSDYGAPVITADPSSKSETEINEIWQAVSDDFAPFNVSVTTSLSRFQAAPASKKMRVIFTSMASLDTWWSERGGAIGVAYLASFASSRNKQCWVGETGFTAAQCANITSHEVGHTLDLKHDGDRNNAYYFGYRDSLVDWNAIMGGEGGKKLTQWSKGEYAGATERQDDIAIIASSGNGFGPRADAVGDGVATASSLALLPGSSTTVAHKGVIEKSSDADVLRVSTGSGLLDLQVRGAAAGPNLYISADLLRADGAVIASGSSSKSEMDVSLRAQVAAGVYYIRVRGRGLPVPAGSVGPYPYDTSGYGSIGQYRITGTIPTGQAVPVLDVDTPTLSMTAAQGQSPAPRVFRVSNSGSGSLSYTINESLPWLSVTPTAGASSGAAVEHSIEFAAQTLAPGIYQGTITVSAQGVEGSPRSIDVTLTVTGAGSDLVFRSPGGISVPLVAGPATPYPSSIAVSGVPANVSALSVNLSGLSHNFPSDLDILLVAPNGQKVMLMSDAGGGSQFRLVNADLTFSEDGPPLPLGAQISTGTYRPTDYQSGDTMPAAAPAGPYGTSLAATLSGSVNGEWRLYVADDYLADGGAISGWSLSFSAGSNVIASPSEVRASDGEFADRVRVSWNAVPGASAYQVFRSQQNDSSGAAQIASVSAGPFDDFSAPAGTTHYYWVRALSGEQSSAFSAGDGGFRRTESSSNDNFASRQPISGNTVAVEASNGSASKELGEPNHAGNAGGKSLWWSWTAAADGTVTLVTSGSSFDTLLGVYTGGSLASLALVVSDDDSGGAQTSRVIFTATAGTTYQIAVDGYGGASGRAVLSLRFDPTQQPPEVPPALQATDGTLGDRVRVTWSAAPNAANYDIRRGTTSDFASSVLLGSVGSSILTYDDLSAQAGTTYQYWVVARNAAGNSPPAGPDAGFRVVSGAGNDNFAAATALQGGSASVSADSSAASKEDGEPNHARSVGGKSLWWTWTAPQSGNVVIRTEGSAIDTVLGVYTGDGVSSLTEVAADDDGGVGMTSLVSFAATSGTVYRIAVDGYGGAGGPISLQLALQPSDAPPLPPALVEASKGLFADRVSITWLSSQSASSYVVRRGTTANFSASTSLATVASDGADSYFDTSAAAGTVYFYWVVAVNAAGSSVPGGPDSGYVLAPTDGNDDFASAALLAGPNAVANASNGTATAEPGEPAHEGNTASRSLWWKWTAPSSGPVTVKTSGSSFDTVLSVYAGAALGSLTRVAGNDDENGILTSSRALFTATEGATYFIAVDGYRGASGAIVLGLETDTAGGSVILSGNLEFGSVAVGQSQTRAFSIINTGSVPLEVGALTLPDGFSRSGGGGALAAGASQIVQVTFAPVAAQSYGGQITVAYGASSSVSIPVSGFGLSGGGTGTIAGLSFAPPIRKVKAARGGKVMLLLKNDSTEPQTFQVSFTSTVPGVVPAPAAQSVLVPGKKNPRQKPVTKRVVVNLSPPPGAFGLSFVSATVGSLTSAPCAVFVSP